MDYSTTNVPTSLVDDTSGHDSSDDDVPLFKLLKKPHDDKQSCGSTHSLTFSSNRDSGKDKSGLDDTSDDEPLIRMKTTSLPAKKPESNENESDSSNGTNNKKADLSGHDSSDDDVPLVKLLKKPKDDEPQCEKTEGLTKDDGSDDTSYDKPLTKMRNAPPANRRNKKASVSDLKKDDSSDDEPLIKKRKASSKAAKLTISLPTKRSVDTDRKESVDDDCSSDDEPLSELAKRLKSQQRTKAPVTPSRKATLVKKSKRKAPRKKVQCVESSSDSSDDEPLIKMKRKRTKGLSEEKVSTNCRKTKPKAKYQSPKDPSSSDGSSDDDVPLVNLIGKQGKPVRKKTEKTKKTPVSRTRKRRGLSDESSDDEPLINLVKKTFRGATNTTAPRKATTPTKRATTSKQPRRTPVSGSSSDSSDDEPLVKGAKNPQVNKILRVILERCDVEEAGATTARLNKTSTEIPIAEESNLSEESAEEA